MYVFHSLGSGNSVAAFWEIMFPKYKYLIVALVCSHLCFKRGKFFLIALFPDHCLLVSFDGWLYGWMTGCG